MQFMNGIVGMYSPLFAHEGLNKKSEVVYALKITVHIVQESLHKDYMPTFDHTQDKKFNKIYIKNENRNTFT